MKITDEKQVTIDISLSNVIAFFHDCTFSYIYIAIDADIDVIVIPTRNDFCKGLIHF